MYENVLIDLLDSTLQDPKYIKERLRTTGLKLEDNLYMVSIDFHDDCIIKYHLVDYLRDHIENLINYSRTVFYLYYYPDYRSYHLLYLARDEGGLASLYHPAPKFLRAYDKEKQTDLFRTLYTYLSNDKNTTISAKKLFIHRNTMNYRLRVIEKMTKINLDDFEECVQMYLSYKMIFLEKSLEKNKKPRSG